MKKKTELKPYNTFSTSAEADEFYLINSEDDLYEIYEKKLLKDKKYFILGGGSNVYFRDDYDGVILKINIKHISKEFEDKSTVIVSAGAGEVWDDFVESCIFYSYYGAENLSLIPGNVGATAVQNIGAYGVEANDIIHEVVCFNLDTGETEIFKNEDCKFSYRYSIFKEKEFSNRVVIYVYYKFSKIETLKLEYGNIKEELKNFNEVNQENLRQAIINIRSSKLPDFEVLPNAGSYFKNPVVDKSVSEELKKEYPNLVTYPFGDKIKLAAGQLIDLCSLKGYRKGSVGVHEKQALVIVNYNGEATGEEIFSFAQEIKNKVFEKFGVELEPEVIAL